MGEKVGETLGEKVGEKTGEKVGESLGEIHKLNLCHTFNLSMFIAIQSIKCKIFMLIIDVSFDTVFTIYTLHILQANSVSPSITFT